MALTQPECEELQRIFDELHDYMGKLRPNEKSFVDDQIKRYEEYAADTRLTLRQWQWLRDLAEKYAR